MADHDVDEFAEHLLLCAACRALVEKTEDFVCALKAAAREFRAGRARG
jgi:hypothetical protein